MILIFSDLLLFWAVLSTHWQRVGPICRNGIVYAIEGVSEYRLWSHAQQEVLESEGPSTANGLDDPGLKSEGREPIMNPVGLSARFVGF